MTDDVAAVSWASRIPETIDIASLRPPPTGSIAPETARYGDGLQPSVGPSTVSTDASHPAWNLTRRSHARDRNGVRRQPGVDAPTGVEIPHLVEGAPQHIFQATDDFRRWPAVRLEVLHPLESADDHTARVAQNVGDRHDAAVVEDRIGLGRHWPVGALSDHTRTKRRRVVAGDLAFEGSQHQQVAVDGDECRVVDWLRTWRSKDGPGRVPPSAAGCPFLQFL